MSEAVKGTSLADATRRAVEQLADNLQKQSK